MYMHQTVASRAAAVRGGDNLPQSNRPQAWQFTPPPGYRP